MLEAKPVALTITSAENYPACHKVYAVHRQPKQPPKKSSISIWTASNQVIEYTTYITYINIIFFSLSNTVTATNKTRPVGQITTVGRTIEKKNTFIQSLLFHYAFAY